MLKCSKNRIKSSDFFKHRISNDSFTYSGFCINEKISTELSSYGKTKIVEVKNNAKSRSFYETTGKATANKSPLIFAILGTKD